MPKGYEEITGRSAIGSDGRPKLVKVVKPIYGMAQAGRRWQRSLFPWLMSKELGFTQSFHDPCVFIKNRKFKDSKGIDRVEKLIVGCYVDDLYVIYDVNGQLYSEFTTLLSSSWQVDDEGEVQNLLGVEIARNKDSVVLKQTAYIQKMVENHFPDGVPANDKDTKYPCDKSIEDLVAVAQADESPRDPESIRKYQCIVGALLYAATNTPPDIALAVSYLCGRAATACVHAAWLSRPPSSI